MQLSARRYVRTISGFPMATIVLVVAATACGGGGDGGGSTSSATTGRDGSTGSGSDGTTSATSSDGNAANATGSGNGGTGSGDTNAANTSATSGTGGSLGGTGSTESSATSSAGGAGGADSTAAGSGEGGTAGAPLPVLLTCLDFYQYRSCNAINGPDRCTRRLAAVVPECYDPLEDLYSCLIDAPPGCVSEDDPPEECLDASAAVDECQVVNNPYGCGTPNDDYGLGGGLDGSYCSVTAECDGLTHRTYCETDADGTVCECYVEDALLDTCTNDGDVNCRGVLEGCCREVYGY